MYETYETLLADYAAHHDGKKAPKITIMSRDEDTRSAFEQAVKDYEIDCGIYEQNEGQKYLETVLNSMGETIVPDPPEFHHEATNEELAAQWEDMTKMYGPGWDK
jgi:ABC-type Zn uptake system ZnuABC Zn-binding protein ZnuA